MAANPTPAATPAAAPARGKKSAKKTVPHGIIHVKATFNNTQVTVTDTQGNTVCWSTAGKLGFKGSKKGTSFAAQRTGQEAAQVAVQHGLRSADVLVKGPGAGRESAIRAFEAVGVKILSIRDVTGMPHNGCRPRKRRRV